MSIEATPFRRGKGFYLGAVIAAAAYLLTFLLIGVLALFAMPQADDFCYASNAMANGLWGRRYKNMSAGGDAIAPLL